MTDPNFLGIGAQKSGTSWLAKMLERHPDVFVSHKKELHFFNKQVNYRKGIKWYRSQFAGYNGEKAVGELTPNYLWISSDQGEFQESATNQAIPKLVYKHYPGIKLVVSLRNPVERAISAYYHHIRMRRVAPTSSIMEVGHKYGIIGMGFYYSHLCEWLRFFTADQILILIYETDIVQNNTIFALYDNSVAYCVRQSLPYNM